MYILFFWYVPCILVDYWAGSHQIKYWVNLLLSILGASGLGFIGTIVIMDNVGEAMKKRVGATFIPPLLIVLCLGLSFSNLACELYYFVALVTGCFIYVAMYLDYYNRTGYEYRLFVMFIAYCQIITMNDWKLTIEAFRTGAIWFTFLRNITLFTILLLFSIVINFLRHCANAWKLDWSALVKWEKSTVQFLAANALSVVFITLYAPLTLVIFDKK